MNETKIICPECKAEIKLTDAVAAPMIASIRAEASESIEAARHDIKLESKKELVEIQARLSRKDLQLAEAQQEQAKTIRLQTELEDAKRELDLTVEKRIADSRIDIYVKAKAEAKDEARLRLVEKEEQLVGMTRKIEELQKKAEQGSQQAQGEALEIELESLLRIKFPYDHLLAVDKGARGADIIQVVHTTQGKPCGAIIWECKNVQAYSHGWLPKLREDQRLAKAEVAVLVTQVMPKGVGSFELIDGVWVVNTKTAIPVATILRQGLIEAASVRQSLEGSETKAQVVYAYLTGTQFRQRIQAIVEAFSSMQLDLNTEKKAITKSWAKRETQIDRVMTSTVGMYGDLQGIAGKTLKEIEGLVLK